jgi:hypothetical protein
MKTTTAEMKCSMNNQAIEDGYLLLGDWMLKNQVKSPFDANCGRSISMYDAKTGYIYLSQGWMTGLMCAALCALHKRTGRQEYLDAAIRAGNYVVSLQVMDPREKRYYGLFRELTPQSIECAPRDATSAAWGLVWLYNATKNPIYLERAQLFAEWHMEYAMCEGWPRYALYMLDNLDDFYAQGSFQSGTGLFYYDLFLATGDARYIERGLRPLAVNYRDRFFNEDGSLILEREAFTGRVVEMAPDARMHQYNDDFGAAMLQVAADLFKDESFRERALQYAQWLARNQDADGNFGGGTTPSGVPTALMYFHDLGQYYQDEELLNARERTLKALLDLQYAGEEDSRLNGGVRGAYEVMGNPPPIPGAPAKHVNLRCSVYSLMALLKLESNLEEIWLGRHNGQWKDPLHRGAFQEHLQKMGYLNWDEARK